MHKISAVEFQRHIGSYQDKALACPVTITRNGRERLVLLSVEEYRRLLACSANAAAKTGTGAALPDPPRLT